MDFLKSPLRVLGAALTAAGALFALGLIFANPEQCPLNATQAQVDATNCNVGANIGLGLIFLVAMGVVVCGVVAAGSIVSARRNQPPPPRPQDRIGDPPAI